MSARRSFIPFASPALGAALIASLSGCAGNQRSVRMDDLPINARVTLEREVRSTGVVESIEKSWDHGRNIYTIDATVNGASWEYVIDEYGNLMHKTSRTGDADLDAETPAPGE